jgi:hypothetical protein
MELVLHIGQSKTGTSAIQHFLSLNRGGLARQRILYPAANIAGGLIQVTNHNSFADAASNRIVFPFLQYEDYVNQYKSAISGGAYGKILLSAEHFFGGEPRIWDCADPESYYLGYAEKIRRIRSFSDGMAVTILVYLRPQVDWFASAVCQTVRLQPLINRGQIYQNDLQFLRLMSPLLNYDRILEIWRSAFPTARFIVVPYVRSELANANIVDDMCERLGVDASGFVGKEITEEVNSTFAQEYTEVKKILNKKDKSRNRERAIIKCLQYLSRSSEFGSGYVLAADVKAAIGELVADSNTALSSEYLQSNPFPIESVSSKKRDHRPSERDVAEALIAFKREFRKPRYRLLELNIATRAYLRENLPSLHSKLHRLKRHLAS